MGRRKRRRVERADDWEQLEILCAWDEQMEYERIRPLVLFGDPVPERATHLQHSEEDGGLPLRAKPSSWLRLSGQQ